MSMDSPDGTGPALRRAVIALVVLTWGLQLWSIWSRPHLPLVDLPNHAARHSLQALWLAGEELPPFYEVRWRLLPNLGGDLFIPLLMCVFAPETAMALAVTLAVLGLWLAAAWFIREQAGPRPGAVLAALLLLPWVFSSQLFWGFFNFYSGLAVAFVALAHFTRLMNSERLSISGLLLHTVLVTLLFLWHLAAWGDYGVVMGALLLAHAWGRRREPGLLRRAVLALPSLPSLVLFGLYAAASRGAPGGARFNWGTWERKLESCLGVFRGYHTGTDALVLLLWLAALVLGFAWLRRREARGGGLLLAMAGLGMLYLLLPFQLGSTSDTDTRLLPALLVCFLAFLGGWPTYRWRTALVLLTFAVVLRYGSVLAAWNRMRDRLDLASESLDHLESGGRVVPVVLVPGFDKKWPELHFACWSVPRRGAFVPSLFTAPDQQPLAIAADWQDAVAFYRRWPMRETGNLAELRAFFDYLWVFDPQGLHPELPSPCTLVFRKGEYSLWRVR